ncbi:MAG: serine hydrolase domain-containing protein [Desulfobaccales bacterium]
MSEPFAPLNQLLEDGLSRGVYTAAVALIGVGGELRWQAAVGRVSRDPGAQAASPATVFDLASLTKPLATALALLSLMDEGRLTIASTLGEFLPGVWLPPDKRSLSLGSLLAHRAGLPAWEPFYQEILKKAPQARRGLLPRLAAGIPLVQPPDTATLYSDLGFMLLQAVVETVSGVTLDRFCEERIYRPMGLEVLGFNPLPIQEPTDIATENRKPETENLSYAATETGLIAGRHTSGEVHDENAWAAGGVAGHAGLFGRGIEVFRLVAALYRTYLGETGSLPFSPAWVRRFLTPVTRGARALGFDTPDSDPTRRAAGRYFSAAAVGHLGFTGVSFWLDLELGQMVVLLTNRVHMGRDAKALIQAFRPRFHEAASLALGFGRAR